MDGRCGHGNDVSSATRLWHGNHLQAHPLDRLDDRRLARRHLSPQRLYQQCCGAEDRPEHQPPVDRGHGLHGRDDYERSHPLGVQDGLRVILKPSVQNRYDAFFSRDPAFIKPPKRGDEEDAAWKKIVAEYKHKWLVARETGNLSGVLSDNGQPTRFTMRQVLGHQMAKLVGWFTADPRNVRKIESLEFYRLLVRCA